MSLTAEVEIGLVTDGVIFECPEDPEALVGQPIGMYHCPDCGEMVVAGCKHPGILEPKDFEEMKRNEKIGEHL